MHRWRLQGGWHRHWLRTLAGDAERVFVISDSRFALAHVIPMRDPRFHVMHLMHNMHTVGARRWDSPLSGHYRAAAGVDPAPRRPGHADPPPARGRAGAYGATNNLFVVPNPVDLPERPDLPDARPGTFAVVARLENQKRLDHAIRPSRSSSSEEPDAQLDIYGDGNLRVRSSR